MGKKYKLTNIIMKHKGRILHRIKALKDFSNVKKGELGGWIENENNLSHYNDCWVYDEGKIYEHGLVYGNGKVYEHGLVYGNGKVHGNGQVYGNGRVFENGTVCNNGQVFDNGQVYENGKVYGNGKVYEYGSVYGNGVVYDNGQVYEYGSVYGDGAVYRNGEVFDGTVITNVSIPYKAIIQMQCKYRTINALLTKDDKIVFNVGCQDNITKEKFIHRIYNDEGGLEENLHRQEYLDYIDFMENYLLSKKGEIK